MIDAGKISGNGITGTINSNFFDVNAERKTNEFVETVDKKIKEYNDNADARMNEYNNTADGLMNIATDTRNELERVKNDVLETGEANGNYLTLNDSTMAELQELEVNSNEKQVTTNGYNLWNFNVDQDTKVKVNDDGTITINGEGGFTLYIEPITLETGKTYYETFELVSGSITGSETVFLSSSPNVWMINKIPVSYTMTEDKERTGIWIDAAATFNNATVKLWITEGEKKDWETYTGLKASPSPDYPQEIPMITTDSVLKSVGKNLCKLTSVTGYNFSSKLPETTNSNFIIEEFDNNSFSYSVKTNNYVMGLTNNIVLEPNTTYILSMFRTDNNVNNYSRNYIYEVNSDGSYSFLAEKGGTGNVETEFTTGTTGVIALGLGVGNNSNGATGTIENIMISKDSTEYEPYQETILNMPIPEGEFVGYINDSLKDTLKVGYNEEDGNYHLYLDKMLGKVVLNGNEEIKIGGVNENITQFDYIMSNQVLYINDNIARCISNHFVSTHFNNSWTRDNTVTLTGNSIRFMSSTFTTLEEFKTWLSSNNVEVVYALANPYTLDLGIVDMPLSYDGTTNIFVDTDLLMNINTKYYRNFTETIRNLQINNDTLKNELVSIENRLSALETANVSVVSESEGEE